MITKSVLQSKMVVRGLTKYFHHILRVRSSIRFTSTQTVTKPSFPGDELEADFRKKILYNTKINRLTFVVRKQIIYRLEKKEADQLPSATYPVSLKYLDESLSEEKVEPSTEPSGRVQFPLKIKLVEPNFTQSPVEYPSEEPQEDLMDVVRDRNQVRGRAWMSDYEKYSEIDDESTGLDDWKLDYGSADRSVPVSDTPCGGCGALLHCQDPSLPGYLPKEIFGECSPNDLRSVTCQRCHFLKNYNTALSVSVDPKHYPRILDSIRNRHALVVILVDLTDFPCSIWPGILEIIGDKKPIFLVGNKIDLLWGDSRGWMEHAKKALRSCFPRSANIRHVSLISSKTGFGVEELINKLHNLWEYRGDVFLVGSTNVGKSTLFNALLASDYCRTKASDLIQRATVAPWPGTTLNLLKFPILRPEGWKLFLRTQRLLKERHARQQENALRKEQLRVYKTKVKSPPLLIGNIGRTFYRKQSRVAVEESDSFSAPNRGILGSSPAPGSGLDPEDPDYVKSKWLYDSPGVMHNDQFLDLLTTEEIMITLPQEVIRPRTYALNEGWSIFIGGLARLDYLQGAKRILMTVFASRNLPVTICGLDDADEVYKGLLGSKYFGVPCGPPARLAMWPGLQAGPIISVCGEGSQLSAIDVVLSSAGWIAISPEEKEVCKLKGWTPLQRGIHVRHPPLLPRAVALRGPRVRRTPAYQSTKAANINH